MQVHPRGRCFLKRMTFASNMVACPLYVSCFSIVLDLSPQARPTPCLYSSNISRDKQCQPQTRRANLTNSHQHIHTDLRGLINKPPAALFQSLQRDTVGLLMCVCVCFVATIQKTHPNMPIYKPIAALHPLECTVLYISVHVICLHKRNPFSAVTLKESVFFKCLTLAWKKHHLPLIQIDLQIEYLTKIQFSFVAPNHNKSHLKVVHIAK